MSAASGGRLALVLFFLACGRQLPPPDVVARIGGDEVVRAAEFEAYLRSSAGEDTSELSNEVLSSLFEQCLDERMLRRLAVDRGAVGAEAGAREAVAALLRLAAAAAGPISERELADYHAAHGSDFARPERLRLRQILTTDRESAEKARAEILAGAKFSAVARRLSRDASAKRGGFQGELGRDDLPPAFAGVLFALPAGEISPVLTAPYGHHVFQVIAHLPARQLGLDEAAPEIRAALERDRGDRALAALVGEAQRRYTLEVYARNLPFRYQATPAAVTG